MKNKAKTQSTRDELRAMRDALGWTDYRLAQAAGLNKTTVIRYLAGDCDTGTEKADALRAAMRAARDGRDARPT